MELNKIYSEDCIKFMRRADRNICDIIVTSPPYNLNKKYSKYKDNIERQEYLTWMGEVAKHSSGILKEDGSFFLNVGCRPSDSWLPFDIAREFDKYFCLQNVLHWIKHISINKDAGTKNNGLNGDISFGHFKPINTSTYLNQCHEYIFHFTKTGKVQLDKLAIGVPYQHKSNVTRWKKKKDLRDRGNVWFIKYKNKQGAVKPEVHPAIFPVKLPYLCVKLHGIKKDTLVYDPFMGIGSSAIACAVLGVNFIGTEIDKEYVKIANEEITKKLSKETRDGIISEG